MSQTLCSMLQVSEILNKIRVEGHKSKHHLHHKDRATSHKSGKAASYMAFDLNSVL